MAWSDFIDIIQSLRQLEPNLSTVTIRSEPLGYLRYTYEAQDRFFAVLRELDMGISFDLAGLLFTTWYWDTSEKRDKVYSILGLIADRDFPLGSYRPLPIDYDIPWSSLCIKATRYCINVSIGASQIKAKLKILKIVGMIPRWKSPQRGCWDVNEVS